MGRSLGAYETKGSVVVRGETFEYTFDKKSGLMSGLEVLGEYFPLGPIPDIYVSPAKHPRQLFYAAQYESHGKCNLFSEEEHWIEVRSEGTYCAETDERFPMTYRIAYQIYEDGVIFVTVRNEAAEACTIRWLCCSKGALEAALCPYVCRLSDQSAQEGTGGYAFERVSDAAGEDGRIFGGHFMPWFWFGNDRTGVEVCVWDVDDFSFGQTEYQGRMVNGLGMAGDVFSAFKTQDGVMWEILPMRNMYTPVQVGWAREDRFALAVTPPRRYDAAYSDLRVHWEGPHQINPSYEYPSEEDIKRLAQRGINLFVGGANWRSGEYIPENEAETRRVIATCHRYGLKIIPYATLMDLNEETDIFQKHGSKWRIEPVVEYAYKTNLMCPGAQGWRTHWKKQMDRIVDGYDFDGIYLDFWFAKLACQNRAHGCGTKLARMTFPWVRDMLSYAKEKIKAKNEDGILIANTNILPMAMISGLVDVRLVGESKELDCIGETEAKAFYNSYRLGINTLLWPNRVEKIDERLIRLWLLYMAPFPLSARRTEAEIALVRRCWDVLRFFGIGKATWYPFFGSYVAATADREEVRVHVHEWAKRLLLTAINTGDENVEAEISIKLSRAWIKPERVYLVYDPLARSLLGERLRSGKELRKLPLHIPGRGFRFLFVREAGAYPTLVFAGGTDGVRRQHWDENRWVLNVRLMLPCEGDVSIAAHSLIGQPHSVELGGERVDFVWNAKQRLVFAQGPLAGEPRVRILYES